MLGDVLSGYLAQYPGVTLEIDLTDRRVDLIEEGFDLAIRPLGPLRTPRSWRAAWGNLRRLKLNGSKAAWSARGAPARPEDLRLRLPASR